MSRRLAPWRLRLLAPLALGAFAVWLGKDATWDFLNYRWYNPYALLHGRLGFDIAPAHHATFYNPIVELPFYLIANHGPAWLATFYLGALAGLAAWCVGALALALFPGKLWLAALLGLLSLVGGATFGQIGVVNYDVALTIPLALGLLALVRGWQAIAMAPFSRAWRPVALAGLCIGAAFGLKLTAVAYVIGLGVALLLGVPGTVWRKLKLTLTGGVSAGAGFLLFGGYWMARVYAETGNPLFPYFNGLFQSPLIGTGSYRDPTFLPGSALDAIAFPFLVSANSMRSAEFFFRDVRLSTLYVLVPLVGVLALLGRTNRAPIVPPQLGRVLFLFLAGTYGVWLALFAIYRYVIPLEMIAPVLILVAVALLPVRRPLLVGLVLLGLTEAAVSTGASRVASEGPYVTVQAPTLPDPDHALVVMTGFQAIAYVIPYFPPQVPFLRIQGWLVGPDDPPIGYNKTMRERVAAHDGPLYLLDDPIDAATTAHALDVYKVRRVEGSCTAIPSNINHPLEFCALAKETP